MYAANPRLRIYPIVVGINKYRAHSSERPINLEFATSDALRVSAFLRQPNEAFECVRFEPLVDDNATSEAIRSRLRTRLHSNQIRQGDVVLFYFAGHGALKNGHAYLCCTDLNLRDPDTGGVRLDDLYQDLQDATAGTVMIILDACISGAISDPGVVPVNVVQQFKSILSIPPQSMSNRIVYAAAHSTQKAREHPLIDGVGGGVFTSALLRGWQAGEAAEKGLVTPQSLQTHLLRSFDNYSGQQPVTVVTGDSVVVLGRFEPTAEGSIRPPVTPFQAGSGLIDHTLNVTPTQPMKLTTPRKRLSGWTVTAIIALLSLLVVGASVLVLVSPVAFLIACAVAIAIGFGSIASSGGLKPIFVLLTIAQAVLLFSVAHQRFSFLQQVGFLDVLASYAWMALLICAVQSLLILFRIFEQATSN